MASKRFWNWVLLILCRHGISLQLLIGKHTIGKHCGENVSKHYMQCFFLEKVSWVICSLGFYQFFLYELVYIISIIYLIIQITFTHQYVKVLLKSSRYLVFHLDSKAKNGVSNQDMRQGKLDYTCSQTVSWTSREGF